MHHPSTYWEELTALALIGTARRPTLPAPPPGPLADLLAQLDAPEPAAALLQAAAATTLYRHAGALPPPSPTEPIPPCPPDAREPCSHQAARLLRTILEQHRPLLPEWLAALNARQRRAPDGAAPILLEIARTTPNLRPALLQAIGERGPWLAALNPAWAFAVATPDDPAAITAAWQTGTRDERLSILHRLRAAQPAQARDLIATTWSSEKADDRAAFITALAGELSQDDEPFLEAALDDRSQTVRSAAADLLARLPASRLAARMTARATELLHHRGGLFARLDVTLPSACDDALQRDGVPRKPPRTTGERAWWLQAIIARTPPSAWNNAWRLSPAAILKLRADAEWRPLLIEAWTTATRTYRDEEWAAALVDHARAELDGRTLADLLNLLPAARRDPVLINMLNHERTPLGSAHPALPALRSGAQWSDPLAYAVIAALRRTFTPLRRETLADWPLREALEDFALALPPALADEAIAVLPPALADNDLWRDTLHTFTERLRLRRELTEV